MCSRFRYRALCGHLPLAKQQHGTLVAKLHYSSNDSRNVRRRLEKKHHRDHQIEPSRSAHRPAAGASFVKPTKKKRQKKNEHSPSASWRYMDYLCDMFVIASYRTSMTSPPSSSSVILTHDMTLIATRRSSPRSSTSRTKWSPSSLRLICPCQTATACIAAQQNVGSKRSRHPWAKRAGSDTVKNRGGRHKVLISDRGFSVVLQV